MEKRKPETAQVTKTSDVIQEGAAKIWQHEYATDKEKKTVKQEVFYNRVQVFNRDLTLLCMVTHSLWNKSHRKEGFRKLKYYDAFTASGLRALRAKLELPDELIAKVIGCDISQDAIKNFRANLTLNKLSEEDIQVIHDDTIKNMSSISYPNFYDLVDIDPYGSAVSYLSSAFNSISNDGMVAITCTDMRVLAGADNHKCYYLYGAVRSRVPCFEEHALRIALASINRIANEQKKAIVPLLCIQKNFYLRIFARVSNHKSDCWSSIAKTGMIYYCGKCANSHVERFGHYDEKKKTYMPNKVSLSSLVCNICGGSWTMNGPVWLDALNDEEFVRNLISNFDAVKKKDTTHSNWPYLKNLVITKTEEINGIIRSVYQEVPVQNNTITWDLTNLFGFVKVGAPKNNMVHAAFHNAGYLYCQSYQNPKGIKTNAPNSFIFDLVKEWRKIWAEREKVPLLDKIEKDSVGYKIMTRESEHQINFEVTQEVLKAEKNRVSNYFPNPEKNWGPKRAAAIVIPREEVEKKKKVHTEETRVDGAGESGSPSQSDDERGPEDDEAEQ